MSKFLVIDPLTVFKEVPCEAECLPEYHLARFILAAVTQMNLSAFEDAYAGKGSKAYPPATLLALFIYGYVTRTFTSRKIEAATYDSIAFRFLAGNTHPDHSSLAEFRKRFQGQFKDIFKQVLVLAYEMGLAKEDLDAAADGSKLRANASKHSALSYGHALKIEAQIEKEIEQLLADAKKAESDNEELPLGLNFQKEIGRRKDLLTHIAEAKAKIELRAKGRDAYERAEYEEKMAKHLAREALKQAKRKVWEAAYPEKAAKCAAREAKKKEKSEQKALTTEAPETVEPAKKSRVPREPVPGPRPGDQVNLTDEESRIMPVSSGGYEQCYNAQAAVATGTLLVLAATVTQATNDKQQIVPMLEALSQMPECLGPVKDLLADTGYFSTTNVDACHDKGITPVIAAAREHHHPDAMTRFTEPPPLPDGATPVQKMAHHLKTVAGRKLYALRKQTVEPVFGIIKSVMGFRQFSMRGLAAAQSEWNLVCLSWNLKRMAVLRLQ